MRRLAGPATLAVAALAVPSAAPGRSADARALWATVNVCDTITNPNTIGIRGSMPGADNHNEQMFMRFRVQYFDVQAQKWHNVRKNGDSGFVPVGKAKFKARQAGLGFVFSPAPGQSFQMRGKVTFEWRLNGKVVRRAIRMTTAGHHSTAGSDPEGYSSDTCVIS
ncbi:MAG: hypothetical protein QOG68_237 [Solirubrobacteraceae bacterium]|jgi:hypothetical protein|nr:hypothetical protein [Solirubrobacteraceae bacterium]